MRIVGYATRTGHTLLSMVQEKVIAVLRYSAVIALGTICWTAAHAESFDKPLQEKVVDLGHSPYLMPSDDRHVKLTCSYYSKFMIKELNDPGNKGALWIAIAPVRPGLVSGCTRRHGPGEKLFKDWDGYFGGVKGDLVFLYDADGDNGGLGFTAFDSKTRAKVFRGSASGDRFKELDFVHVSDTQMTLRYLRIVSGDCSLPNDGSACWSKFKEQLGLALAPMPKCDYHGEDVRDFSVVAYPVEVSLFPKPSIRALANPDKCWAAD